MRDSCTRPSRENEAVVKGEGRAAVAGNGVTRHGRKKVEFELHGPWTAHTASWGFLRFSPLRDEMLSDPLAPTPSLSQAEVDLQTCFRNGNQVDELHTTAKACPSATGPREGQSQRATSVQKEGLKWGS